nr:adenosylcobinamide amidohydrolase [Actinospica robiniae]
MDIVRAARLEDGACRHMLAWRAGPGWRMVSSSVLGGGLGEREWVLNAQVRAGYDRMDPEAHLRELASGLDLRGPGVGLMTAASVDAFVHAADDEVEAVVTAGLGVPTWAAAPDHVPAPYRPGTINIIAAVPAALTDAALINCIGTATEAKVQALLDAGYDCSGTPSDAVCIAARTAAAAAGAHPEPFGGPRSRWGARLARAVYTAVYQSASEDAARRAHGEPAVHAETLQACTAPPLETVRIS